MKTVILTDESIFHTPLLDSDQIDLLREALDPADLREMYVDLPQSARDSVSRIEQAIRVAADMEQVRQAAHVLKGVGGSFGTLRLAAVAAAIELRASSVAEAEGYLSMLTEVLEQTLIALSDITGGASAMLQVQA